MQRILTLIISFFMLALPLQAAQEYSIVFIHIGEKLPEYLPDALFQARLFNQDCKMFLLANQAALNNFTPASNLNLTQIPLESLIQTAQHTEFIKKTRLSNGFWRYASERFLYLYDFIEQFNEVNIFHLESDTLLYADLTELLPTFLDKYNGIGAVFDNDDRCIPCFVYISRKRYIRHLADCFLQYAANGKNDMEVLALLQKNNNRSISNLPIIMSSYQAKHPLQTPSGKKTVTPDRYSTNIDSFNSIFDGAALGQYLGGIDPRHGLSEPGFVNESCLFNPQHLAFTWATDNLGRKIPYMTFGAETYRINNLHIHSKNLKPFLSVDPTKSDFSWEHYKLPDSAGDYSSLGLSNNIPSAIMSHSNGRFGDTLLVIAHALYFSLKYDYTLLYEPFNYADQLVLSTSATQATPAVLSRYKKHYRCPSGAHRRSSQMPSDMMHNTLITIPYFAESLFEYTQEPWPFLLVDWEDPIFKSELRRLLSPLVPVKMLTPPLDKISIAVHARKGGSYDNWATDGSADTPIKLYKSPFDEYYINAIKHIADLLDGVPLYAFVFTDDENPQELVEKIQAAVNRSSIEFDYRKEENRHDKNVLEDFYSMMNFDILIRPDSNFSIMAEKLGEHALVVSPGNFLQGLRVQACALKINKSLSELRTKKGA
jgi:hypothetical protein